jgi:uncharacterized protein (DUF58 family)
MTSSVRVRALTRSGRAGWARGLVVAEPALRRLRPVLAIITRFGWWVVALTVAAWALGLELGWKEMMLFAAGALTLLVIAALLTIGRARITVTVTADPQRVTVGEPAAGDVRLTNIARTPLLPIGLELPIGDQAARFQLPYLAAGATREELFIVPTDRRGVVNVGPAITVRGDPFGLMRRTISWTGVLQIFVHPVTVPLEPLGAGLLRDLEGQTTNDLSMSDLDFHALREYQPGDDRRYIHWRSSAKAGRFLIRQFLDTRRSHICLMVDSDVASYPDPLDYEMAISVAASISVRAVQDEQEVTAFAGAHVADSHTGTRILDTYSRAELADHGLLDLARRAARLAPDASIALMVTGPLTSFAQLSRAAAQFPVEVKTMVLRIDTTRRTSIAGDPRMPILNLQKLSDLGPLLRGALS